MVTNVTSLGRSGLYDWLLQRATALILGVYCIYLMFFMCTHVPLSYAAWVSFYASVPVQLFTAMALLSYVVHAWIGLWTVTTDYLNCSILRIGVQLLIITSLVLCLFWGISIVWGIG